MKKQFFIEMTDTYGEDANYSWVNRFLVSASSFLGACRKIGKETGLNFSLDYNAGDFARYNAKNACICIFVYESDGEEMDKYSRIKTI